MTIVQQRCPGLFKCSEGLEYLTLDHQCSSSRCGLRIGRDVSVEEERMEERNGDGVRSLGYAFAGDRRFGSLDGWRRYP